MRQSKKGNPEKLATVGTQDEEKQSKNITQYVSDSTMRKQKQQTYVRLHPPTNNWKSRDKENQNQLM